MYLKKLELLGFKSFVDRTELVFDRGLTGIVGPNGCGKSNVVDAFKWILGEQSAKGLRGSEMKDVIFSGTQSRKPAGFAEVTVVFDNADRYLDIDFNEVAFTRRLFRSGESEYLINRQRCRLRDIKSLLMDTGVGASSYSIFEQGKIDVLLQANPQDRRIIFEEAAGISKYRARKAETLRALQRVEDNLARLGDVISELEKRQRRVKTQATKARRYREYADRLRDLRVQLAVDEFQGSTAERAELTSQRKILDVAIEGLDRTVRRLREGLQVQSRERVSTSENLHGIRARLADIRGQRERLEESINHNRRRLDELVVERQRKESERSETGAAIDEAASELGREREALEELEREVASRRDDLQRYDADLSRLRDEHNDLREALESTKKEVVACFDARSRLTNQEGQIDSEIASLQARRERLQRQLGDSRQELDDTSQRVESIAGALREERQSGERLDADLERRRQTARELDAQLEQAQARVQELRAQERGATERLDLLRQLEESLEGVSRGVADILEREERPEGVHDMLARLLRVDSRYAAALEAVLGSRSEALVVEDEEGALALMEEAREGNAGALELYPLDRAVAPVEEIPRASASGILGFLREHVDVDAPYADLVDRLLAGVVLVNDLRSAFALGRNGTGPYRLVTLDGEILEPSGAMVVSGDTRSGLISRRSEMLELQARLETLRESLEGGLATTTALEEERQSVQEVLRSLAAERDEVTRRIASSESQLQQVEIDRKRASRQVEVTEGELRELEEAAGRLREEREALDRRLAEVETRRGELETASQEREEALRQHGHDVHRVAELVTESRVAVSEGNKRLESARRSVAQMERSLADRRRHRDTLAESIDELGERHETTAGDLAEAEEALTRILADDEECTVQAQQAEKADEEMARIEQAFRDEVDRLAEIKSEKIARRNQIELKDQEGILRRTTVLEKISDEYDIDLPEMLDRIHREPEGESLRDEGTEEAASQDAPPAGAAVATDGEADGESPDRAVAPAEVTEATAVQRRRDESEPAGEVSSPGDADGAPSGSLLEAIAATAEASDAADADEPQSLSVEDRLRAWLADRGDWDREDASEEARDLQRRIRNLGNVNMEALEELEEIQERLEFQVSQRDDLLKAERDLRQIINEINKTSRERFTKTFEEVQRNFRALFEKCFGGGKAELVLDEDVDILDSGIDIVARPPGKKLQHLSLMSGGEKTMTTIALMFAIFRARPSPFCILDEVDAPLDENNVRRFVVLVNEFIEQSQFIVVTHNKITMAVADRLYGVTMQEKGVSKQVAVEFEKYDPDNPHESMSTADVDAAPLVEATPRADGEDGA